MANYCFNSLEVSGSVEDIKKLEEFIKNGEENDGGGDKYTLDKIIPVGIDDDGCYKIDDVCESWGTKWIAEIEFQSMGNSAVLSFDTAWSPSLPITLEMSRRFNLSINHYYEESGCNFEGNYEVDNGVVVSDTSGDYRPYCEDCGEKFDVDKMIYDEDCGVYYCIKCGDELAGIVMEKIEGDKNAG